MKSQIILIIFWANEVNCSFVTWCLDKNPNKLMAKGDNALKLFWFLYESLHIEKAEGKPTYKNHQTAN